MTVSSIRHKINKIKKRRRTDIPEGVGLIKVQDVVGKQYPNYDKTVIEVTKDYGSHDCKAV